MTREPARALVLFDIDGTLLRRAGPHHRQALEEAVFQVTGRRATTDSIPVQGMLDRDILRLMMLRAGASEGQVRRQMRAVVERAQELYVERCPDLRGRVCPGVRAFLRRLSRRGIPMGLVTGNLSRIGWMKMERAGLKEHFRLGAFAEQGPTRTALAGLAARLARREKVIAPGARIVLVGDHPNDIAAARGNGFFSLAVATGLSPAGELAEHKPDLLVPDLRSVKLERILEP
jgi:phosphoglycolate phosphatase-like HAD superfamily hydrolase